MEPRISSGDLALVHSQPDVESGDLAVVLVDGEEGTLKKVLKKEGAVILQPFNPAYQTQVFIGGEIDRLTIVGKVVETKPSGRLLIGPRCAKIILTGRYRAREVLKRGYRIEYLA